MRRVAIGIATFGLSGLLPFSAMAQTCPAGFFAVDTGLQRLGCIQTATPSPATATWTQAVENCFGDHGGRLPTPMEHVAARTLGAYTPPTAEIWTGERQGGTGGQVVLVIQEDGDFVSRNETVARDYRCFVPAGGEVTPHLSTVPLAGLVVLGAWLLGHGARRLRRDRGPTSPT